MADLNHKLLLQNRAQFSAWWNNAYVLSLHPSPQVLWNIHIHNSKWIALFLVKREFSKNYSFLQIRLFVNPHPFFLILDFGTSAPNWVMSLLWHYKILVNPWWLSEIKVQRKDHVLIIQYVSSTEFCPQAFTEILLKEWVNKHTRDKGTLIFSI